MGQTKLGLTLGTEFAFPYILKSYSLIRRDITAAVNKDSIESPVFTATPNSSDCTFSKKRLC